MMGKMTLVCGLLLTGIALSQPAAKVTTGVERLSQADRRAGWIQLFDGESTFGWLGAGRVALGEGTLILGPGDKPSALESTGRFGRGLLRVKSRAVGPKPATVSWLGHEQDLGLSEGIATLNWDPDAQAAPTPIRIAVPAGTRVEILAIDFQPLVLAPIFNGKDLGGWKLYRGDAKREKSKFSVTPAGELNVLDGPGDLQTEKQWADFVFQGECLSHGKHLNSGIFFRCLPGDYQQGYEMQIRNQWEGDDRNKPVDFGTGAIYRRQPARRVVSNDGEWFAMTLMADGNRFRTWVEGFPVLDWVDARPENANARQGFKKGPGCLSIQGHDPTTNLSFRNLRVAEWAPAAK